jgi:cryptochrome
LEKWKTGQTGYPFIDAGMRQLLQEGWIHHTVRNAVAVFLTRGDLWLNWEKGGTHFYNNLVDSDWAVNAGNWMWVSSSAFERVLNCSICIDSVMYGKRLEPSGDYIRRYVPELANFEFEHIHEPWKASLEVQRGANCILGVYLNDRCMTCI